MSYEVTCSQTVNVSDGSADQSPSKLAELQTHIAALRVRAQADLVDGATTTLSAQLSMVNIFNPAIRPAEGLSTDRDSAKRDDKIMTLLRERGARRVLGAVASPALACAISELYDSHANFTDAIDYILAEEALARQGSNALCGLRLLLCGGAGVGKTDFALSLSKLLAVPSEVISLSAAQASAHLAGSEQYWSNTQPGCVWKQLVQGTHANPLFVLDELDKVCDKWGDPLGALYQLLETRTASIFCDKSLPWLPLDASRVHWIATANDPEQIHPAIRSRFVEVNVTTPSENALRKLVQRLYVNLLTEFDLLSRFPNQLSEQQAALLLSGSIRDAKRILRASIGRALREHSEVITLKRDLPKMLIQQRIGFI